MLHAKFAYNGSTGSGEENFEKAFRHISELRLGHVTWMLHIKFVFFISRVKKIIYSHIVTGWGRPTSGPLVMVRFNLRFKVRFDYIPCTKMR